MLETKNIQLEKASTILLRAVGDGGNRNMGLTSCFSKPLPLLQTLCLDDQRTNMYRHSFQDLFPLYIPSLRSLYLPTSAPSFLGGSFANLNNLGLLVWDTGTLRNFIELISNARSINHLTLYANDSEVIDLEGYTPSSIPVLDFLTSLRLSRYLGSDIDNIHTVVKSFAAPHLGTLELAECGFTIIPEVAIKHVTKLVCSQLYWTTSDDLPDFFQPLYDGSPPSFPKLHTLAVRDEQWRDMGPRIEDNPWWPSLLALIKSREGKLTKLALSFTLPEALQKSLQDYKIEVTADFELDPHGFPMDVL
ncbi:hypothetical protein DL93DRAFT_2088332 [Clavulina sp. PMI_390]|nr:hypothetical protein DL93DRAFT_2088332 [Clavulina sp. PMI_390]